MRLLYSAIGRAHKVNKRAYEIIDFYKHALSTWNAYQIAYKSLIKYIMSDL